MFCDVGLAARIERAECELLRAIAARTALRSPGTVVIDVGGGIAVCTEPGSPIEKVAGLGFAPLDPAAWRSVVAAHDRRGAPVQVELSTLADPAIGAMLTAQGHRLVGVENVLGRALAAAEPAPDAADGIIVEGSDLADFDHWLDATVTGFATPDDQGVPSHERFPREPLERAMRDMAGAEGFVRYVARRGGEIAGTATMRCHGDVVQLCGATTLPAHRRRGVQAALLLHRLLAAASAGCRLAVVTTQPGSQSQQNVARRGFALLYSRNVLRRDAATA